LTWAPSAPLEAHVPDGRDGLLLQVLDDLRVTLCDGQPVVRVGVLEVNKVNGLGVPLQDRALHERRLETGDSLGGSRGAQEGAGRVGLRPPIL
jgi:hypothetical protein